MLILWGAKTCEKNLGKSNILIRCEHCKREENWNYVQVRQWVTLYLIPLIPLPRYNEFRCPVCDFKVVVTKENSEQILPLIDMK